MRISSSADIKRILTECRRIAVVGMSEESYRPSSDIGNYLIRVGYEVIPVNPNYQQLAGQKCYPSLQDIPTPVDIVNVFRNPAYVMPVVKDAIAIGAKVLWLQLGVSTPQAIAKAAEAELEVVAERCIKVDHARYMQSYS